MTPPVVPQHVRGDYTPVVYILSSACKVGFMSVESVFFSVVKWSLVFLLLLIISRYTSTRTHTNTLDGSLAEDGSARRRDLHQHNTQHSEQADIHTPGVIRSRIPSKQATTDPQT